jgi:hypothetical protein
MRKELRILAIWDAEAGVWAVIESDVPGLAAEAPTEEALLAKLRILVPELVVANKHLLDFEPDGDVPIRLTTEREERLRA